MVHFLKKKTNKAGGVLCESTEHEQLGSNYANTMHQKSHTSKTKYKASAGSLKDYHVKTESTEEESYSESYSKSFDSGNSESWDTDSNTNVSSDSDSEDSRQVLKPRKGGKNGYQLHTMEKHEEERVLKNTHNKACRHLRDGRLAEAKATFEEILATLVKEYGEENRRVGAALHNLAIVHLRSGNMTDAVDAIEEAVRIRKSTLGEFHPKVSDSLVELGIVLLSQENFEDSIEIFNEALHIRERQLVKATEGGQDEKQIKQQIAKISNNIGCAYFEWGDTETANEVFNETLELQKEISDTRKHRSSVPEMLTMSSIICNIGQVHLENSHWQDATSEFQKALEIQESILNIAVPSDHDILLATRENLAYAAVKYGSYDFAKQIYREILQIHETSNNNEDLEEAEVMKKIAFTHIKLYEYDDALDMLQDVKEIHPSLRSSARRKLNRLIAALHYQATKYPAPKELMVRTLTNLGFRSGWNNDLLCRCGGAEGDVEEIDVRAVAPKRPLKGAKMSGHKVSFS